MERLPFEGVTNATNAFAVSDGARTAYLHDPKADVVVEIDLATGRRRSLKWDDKNFAHRRWVCYSLFTMTKAGQDYLSILFFNQHKKVFCLVHFLISGELLVKIQTNALNTSTINKERLAYSVSKDEHEMQIIFYERFTSSASSPSLLMNQPGRLKFVFCAFNSSTMRVATRNGLLPTNGQWELPFLSNNSLHFISTASTPHLFISYPRSSDCPSWEMTIPQPIGIMAIDGQYPPRKALWCNAWRRGVGWFSVTEKIEDQGDIVRRTSLWKLDVESEWKWRRHPATLDTPPMTKSISLRLSLCPAPPSSSSSSPSSSSLLGFLHVDGAIGEAALYKIRIDATTAIAPPISSPPRLSECIEVDESDSSTDYTTDEDEERTTAVLRRTKHKGRYGKTANREAVSDLMCPICLDTYEDARTLACGHSMCWECIEQMRISAKNETIRCPNCRQPTTIPPGGLPINYGLKDAITALSRLVVTRRGCLRCVGCRDKTETEKMWVCVTCYRLPEKNENSSPSKPSSLKRPTSLFLPHRDIEEPEALLSPGARSVDFIDHPTGKAQMDVSKVSRQNTSPPSPDRLLRFAYCATCLLNDHAGHEYEGLSKLRERAGVLARKREEYCRRAAATVDGMRERTKLIVESTVCNPLLTMVTEKLTSLADSVDENEEKEVERRSEDVLNRLEEIAKLFAMRAPESLEALLESCKSCQDPAPIARRQYSTRSLGLPTQL